MGRSNYSHGKKFDKETQSPVLKIFKEIMTREKDDPEKRNLLTEQKEDKKRRQYSGSRTKMERRSCESSSSEHRKRGTPYKVSSTEQRAEFKQNRSQIAPFEGEKKDSWWFWQKDQNNPQNQKNRPTEDTSCSRVSCASAMAETSRWKSKFMKPRFKEDVKPRSPSVTPVNDEASLKRIMSSEYACISCLLLLFTISIVVAFLVVFKSVPTLPAEMVEPLSQKLPDSERLKRKIEMLSENRMKNDLSALEPYRNDKHGFDDSLTNGMGLSGVGVDFGPSFRELNALDESDNNKLSGDLDWSSVLETDKTNEMQSSEKLKEFYKKLVQTDAKIKDLKKLNQNLGFIESDDVLLTPDRLKRSLKLFNYPKRFHVVRRRRSLNKDHNLNDHDIKKKQCNRSLSIRAETEEPTGFVIEKKKLIVQYKPSAYIKRRLPVKKCSHAPKDVHTHEKQLKHPFYKNTQRLDELLDKFLNKNLPELMTDPFGLDELFKHPKNKCKHPIPISNNNAETPTTNEFIVDQQITKPKIKSKKVKENKPVTQEEMMMLRSESSTMNYEKPLYQYESKMVGKEKQKIVTDSPNDFEVLLSVSTIMNPDVKKSEGRLPVSEPLLDKLPNIRRLMQVDGEEDENLGYEDFKEVLTDDMENHDEMDKRGDRKRRNEQPLPLPASEKIPKYNPPGVHNPNWKGPMPLYPDELNSMIRHAAMNANKVDVPNSRDLQALSQERRVRDLTDVEYVEDYLNNKYDKLIEMAQAYSDYGVLDGKKESRNEKNSPSDVTDSDHRVKMSSEKRYRADVLGRIKKGRLPSIMTEVTDSSRRQRQVLPNDSLNITEQPGVIPHSIFYSTQPHCSEGVRFELRPSTRVNSDEVEVLKLLQKHVKFGPSTVLQEIVPKPQNAQGLLKSNIQPANDLQPNLMTTSYPEMELICSTRQGNPATGGALTSKKYSKGTDDIENEHALIFALGKRRNLLSVDFKSTEVFRIDTDPPDDRSEKTNKNESPGEDLFQNLNLKQTPSLPAEPTRITQNQIEELFNYMNTVTRNNIRMYSTALPDYIPMISRTTKAPTTTVDYMTSVSSFDAPQRLFVTNPERSTSILNLNETVVKINRSETRLSHKKSGNTFEGKILLTVESPEYGTENIDLKFDIPLVINFNDDAVMMGDRALMFGNEQNDTDDTDFDPNPEDNVDSDRLVRKRFKRETKVKLKIPKKDSNITKSHLLDKGHSDLTEHGKNCTETAITIENHSSTNKNSKANKSTTITIEHNINSKANISDPDNMNLSDFFKLISNWFKALDGFKENKTKDHSGNVSTEITTKINNVTENLENITDTAYPNYDSDMIENIGHRSRVLLSMNTLANATDEKKEIEDTNVTRVKIEDATGGNVSNVTSTTSSATDPKSNITMAVLKTKSHSKIKDRKRARKTKTKKGKLIFKRNADDSNLIFWDDIYDDEYGIQTDNKLEDSMRNMHSAKEHDFIKRSGRWVHDKIRKFAANLKMNPHTQDVEIKERIPRSAKHPRVASYPKDLYTRIADRFMGKEYEEKEDVLGEEEDYNAEQKNIFTSLAANMKEVCKKAARAVQQTRNIEVREDSKQGTIATSLMQQLVRLLTDLVDYQVQQKTCTRLPADLQKFLEWLTLPKEEMAENQQESLTYKNPFQEEDLIEELELQTDDKPTDKMDLVTSIPNDKQSQAADARMHHLECLHSIQDLLGQFEEMSDDEKSKMTGVKNYLENQIRFLNKQLTGYDLYTIFENNNQQLRYKRAKRYAKNTPTKPRRKRKLHRFMKNFGKKHTRTTASYYDAIRVTEMKRKIATIAKDDGPKAVGVNGYATKDVKRNLKDVYYKAVAEAKKYAATAKNNEITSFGTTPSPDDHT